MALCPCQCRRYRFLLRRPRGDRQTPGSTASFCRRWKAPPRSQRSTGCFFRRASVVNSVLRGRRLGSAWKGSGFFTCSAPAGVGGQDGLEGSNGLALPRDQPADSRAVATNDAGSSDPRTHPGAPFRRNRGSGETVAVRCWLACYCRGRRLLRQPRTSGKSAPSTHMRCMTTASRRARATLATFTLALFAIRMAQDLNVDQRP